MAPKCHEHQAIVMAIVAAIVTVMAVSRGHVEATMGHVEVTMVPTPVSLANAKANVADLNSDVFSFAKNARMWRRFSCRRTITLPSCRAAGRCRKFAGQTGEASGFARNNRDVLD